MLSKVKFEERKNLTCLNMERNALKKANVERKGKSGKMYAENL